MVPWFHFWISSKDISGFPSLPERGLYIAKSSHRLRGWATLQYFRGLTVALEAGKHKPLQVTRNTSAISLALTNLDALKSYALNYIVKEKEELTIQERADLLHAANAQTT